ncbi:MAG: hypothetical protein ACOY33_06635 [Pseudomonadota bacterium]
MSTFLLLVGLALFISGAAMYFAHASRHDPRWVGGSLLFPFVVPMYYRRHWDDLYIAAFLQSAGLVMTISGALMLVFQSNRPEGLVEDERGAIHSLAASAHHSGFVDSARALQLLSRNGAGTPVSGRVHGQPFVPDRVEFIDNTLRLIEGREFLPEREIAIRFSDDSIDIESEVKRAIAPGATEDVPVVQITWRGADRQPVTEVFRSNYRLELAMSPLSPNKLSGEIRLMLPDRMESYVGGDMTVITSHLRYIDDVVDRTYDHQDTLRFVVEEYLQTHYPAAEIDRIEFDNTVLDSLEGRGQARVAVRLKDGRVGNHIVLAARSASGWNVLVPESAAATEAAGYKSVYSLTVPAAPARTAPVAPVSSAPIVRTLPFSQLGSLAGQGATVEYRSGRREQGVLRGLRKDRVSGADRLALEAQKAGGVVEYLIAPGELQQLRLGNGDLVRLEGGASVPAAAVPEPAVATAPPAASAPSSLQVGGTDLTPYLNRNVRVEASNGKTTVGVLRGLNKDGLVIETLIGAGKIEHIVPVDQFVSISNASP